MPPIGRLTINFKLNPQNHSPVYVPDWNGRLFERLPNKLASIYFNRMYDFYSVPVYISNIIGY